ncbi:hypothetical protein JCM8097_000388 [Rhodosporidiobolus ruineniae]
MVSTSIAFTGYYRLCDLARTHLAPSCNPPTARSLRRSSSEVPEQRPAEPVLPLEPSHADFFDLSAVTRGAVVGRKVKDVLRESLKAAGRYVRITQFIMPEDVIRLGVRLAKAHEGKAVFIDPYCMAPPFLNLDYRRAGFASYEIPRFSTFKPNLLKFVYIPAIDDDDDDVANKLANKVTLEVIDVKSTAPASVRRDGGLWTNEDFLVSAWHYFLKRHIHALVGFSSSSDEIRELVLLDQVSVWRYTGCNSEACTRPECFLNHPHTAASLEHRFTFERRFQTRFTANDDYVRQYLIHTFPRELGATPVPPMATGRTVTDLVDRLTTLRV